MEAELGLSFLIAAACGVVAVYVAFLGERDLGGGPR